MWDSYRSFLIEFGTLGYREAMSLAQGDIPTKCRSQDSNPGHLT